MYINNIISYIDIIFQLLLRLETIVAQHSTAQLLSLLLSWFAASRPLIAILDLEGGGEKGGSMAQSR